MAHMVSNGAESREWIGIGIGHIPREGVAISNDNATPLEKFLGFLPPPCPGSPATARTFDFKHSMHRESTDLCDLMEEDVWGDGMLSHDEEGMASSFSHPCCLVSPVKTNHERDITRCLSPSPLPPHEKRLPPHELLAKQYARSQLSNFSVIEGAGRTLKGRDARKVRDSVWKQTGFPG